MVKELIKKTKRRTPTAGPGVRQLHQRRLERSRVRGGPRQGPAPDRPLRLALMAGAVLTVGTIFGAAIFHVLLIQSEFRLDHLKKEAAREEVRYEKLRLDVAQLSAPERIVATAQQRLGMVVPPQVRGALISREIDGDDVLATLSVPVLVTHGRSDTIVLPSMAEHVLDVCKTATPSWYDGVGHAPLLEDHPRFNHELADLAAGLVNGGYRTNS